jgi:hypothetical protein
MLRGGYSGGTARKQDGWDKSLRRRFNMHLIEFADPKEYTPIAADAEDFLAQLLCDDYAPIISRYEGKQPAARPKKLPNEL